MLKNRLDKRNETINKLKELIPNDKELLEIGIKIAIKEYNDINNEKNVENLEIYLRLQGAFDCLGNGSQVIKVFQEYKKFIVQDRINELKNKVVN